MLKVTIVLKEAFDEENSEFVPQETAEIRLEHSLDSLSRWESKWEKPFLGDQEKTVEETLDYIRFMCLEEVDDEILHHLSQQNIKDISDYINAKKSATWINTEDDKKGKNREVITSELIYYWMVAHRIPFECQYWHLNRLMMLVQVCNMKNQPEKKMSKRQILERNRELNRQRREKYNTKG